MTKLFGFWYHNWSVPERILGCAAVVLLLLAVCSWPFSHRILPLIADRRKRMATIIACSAAGPIWFQFVPQLVLPARAEIGQLIVTMLWLMVPCAILVGVVYGLEQAARRAVTAGS